MLVICYKRNTGDEDKRNLVFSISIGYVVKGIAYIYK